jgi:hypothetical protein
VLALYEARNTPPAPSHTNDSLLYFHRKAREGVQFSIARFHSGIRLSPVFRAGKRVRGAVRHCCVSSKACVLATAGRETATSWGERRYASSEETDGVRSVAFRRKAQRRVGLRRVRAFVSLSTMSSSTDPDKLDSRQIRRR